MSYLIYFLFISLIFIVFYFVGGYFKHLLKLNEKLSNILIGASISFGALFLLSFLLIYYQRSFSDLFIVLTLFFTLFTALGLWKTKIEFKAWDILFVFLYILLFILLSSKIPLGEQMGDNVFYFQEVSLNIDNPILQSFSQANGVIYDSVVYYNDTYFTFYFFFSYVVKLITLLSSYLHLIVYPTYVYNMWIANALFFGLSAVFILNIIHIFKIKTLLIKLSLISFLALFIGTYYYHLTLAHIGNTFLYIFISFSILIIYDYLKHQKMGSLFLLNLLFYAIISAANVGVIISFYLAFSLFVYSLIVKNKHAYIMLSILFVPIIHYLFLLAPVDGILSSFKLFNNIIGLPIAFILIIILSIFLYKKEHWHPILYKISYVTMFVIWFGLLGLNLFGVSDYVQRVFQFSDVKANFDRVQDYFTFNSLSLSIINLVHYFIIFSLFLLKDTRKIAYLLLILIIFFINPFMYPLIYDKILWLYQRAYFTLFNLGTLGIGIIAISVYLDKHHARIRTFLSISLIIISITYGYLNLSVPISPIYIASDTFNPIYKLPQEQVDILEKTKQIIEIEEMDTPRIVSQIYSTLFYIERMDSIAFNTAQRRGLYYLDDYGELEQIFYTPIFVGDDGLRLSAPVQKTCELLMSAKIDFVIYDKNLSVFDEAIGNWMPTYWYARNCYTKTYENDRYILYRFFW